jgi:hypothetical protein
VEPTFHTRQSHVTKLNRFVYKYRTLGGQILWVKPVPWIAANLPDNINKLYQENLQATFYVQQHVKDYATFPAELEIAPSDMILEKPSYSAFTNPTF